MVVRHERLQIDDCLGRWLKGMPSLHERPLGVNRGECEAKRDDSYRQTASQIKRNQILRWKIGNDFFNTPGR